MYVREEKRLSGSVVNGAVPENHAVTFTITVPRDRAVNRVNLFVWADGDTASLYEMQWKDTAFGEERWETVVSGLAEGLYFYNYELFSNEGRQIFGGESEPYLTENADRQLLVYSADFDTPAPFRGAMIYHIFVDRFRKSGRARAKKGALINDDWYGGIPQYGAYPGAEVKNNVFFGGDLWGIIEKLPYIRSLGTDYIYLSPVFDAASNHKYDTGDYLSVDEMFGGDEALSALVSEAKKYGMRVILDGVFNHTGSDSIYFNKEKHYDSVGAYNSRESEYSAWYKFRDFPDDYECWWGVRILPRVDSSNPTYRKFITEKVIAKWMDMGVAGWRLDVADELSDEFLDDLRRKVKSHSGDAVIIGEVWEDASNKTAYEKRRRYLRGAQLDSVMNYPFRDAVIAYVRDGDGRRFSEIVSGVIRRYPKCVVDSLMNFLGTHDTDRIITLLGGDSPDGLTNDDLALKRMPPAQYRRAEELTKTAFMLIGILPGTLSVYYGDEIGLEGYHDPFCRRPFPWGNENLHILSVVRRIGEIRRSLGIFADGSLRILSADENCALVMRVSSDETYSVVCIVNRSDTPLTVFSVFPGTDLFTGASASSVCISPHSATYVRYDFVPDDLDVRYSV